MGGRAVKQIWNEEKKRKQKNIHTKFRADGCRVARPTVGRWQDVARRGTFCRRRRSTFMAAPDARPITQPWAPPLGLRAPGSHLNRAMRCATRARRSIPRRPVDAGDRHQSWPPRRIRRRESSTPVGRDDERRRRHDNKHYCRTRFLANDRILVVLPNNKIGS